MWLIQKMKFLNATNEFIEHSVLRFVCTQVLYGYAMMMMAGIKSESNNVHRPPMKNPTNNLSQRIFNVNEITIDLGPISHLTTIM